MKLPRDTQFPRNRAEGLKLLEQKAKPKAAKTSAAKKNEQPKQEEGEGK